MPPAPDDDDRHACELLLKTVAPRVPAHFLARPRLSSTEPALKSRQITVVQAPAGFGKTCLLAQWRRECLMRGTAVAWLSADERDDPRRLLLGLVHAIRAGCARPQFGRTVLEGAMAPPRDLDGLTGWLAEIAQLSLDIVLIVDEIERLPAASIEALSYLFHNAPPNLQFIAAARQGLEFAAADLEAYGQGVKVGPEALRFRFDETISLIRSRFGTRVNADDCARVHECTDGWPLGLQLALAAMDRAGDPCRVIDAMSTHSGTLRDHFVTGLMSALSREDSEFLTRISIANAIHPDLCCVLSADPRAAEQLARLVRETPFFTTAENAAWCRLHLLVGDAFRVRLAGLPAAEQAQLHARAANWLMQHGMIEEAARHAHAAGEHQIAYELAERCLHDAVTQGHLGAVLEWLKLIPQQELERRPRLRLAAAWALALGERHGEAQQQVERILASADTDVALQYECALITSAAAFYSDEFDRFIDIFEPWVEAPPQGPAWLLQAHANRLATRAMLHAEPAQARRGLQAIPRGELDKRTGYIARWGDLSIGQSYFVEGKMHQAEQVLRPALESAETDLGRRHPLTCMFAATLAAVVYGADRIDEASTLLANRLDVLEHAGTPDTVIYGYRTAACVAAAQGVAHRALDLLDTLDTIGSERRLPRLCIASLGEQIRMHAGRYRAETCEALVRRMTEIATGHGASQTRWARSVALPHTLSQAYAAMAARRWREALEVLSHAGELAETMKLGRARIEVIALRAWVIEQTQGHGRTLLLEAINLAQTFDLMRIIVDAHPELAHWVARVSDEALAAARGTPVLAARHIVPTPAPRAMEGPRALPSMVFTPKEREILELLARNLSNKEIALALAIGEATVKWHLKNLFRKLDASTRKHVVHRATALGLLESSD
ncbi:MAG TPA: LuxR C-terminal-related transcriptional regulator [Paraburkholderia sp.]|nr:LuxR C-terminal-related transcriptional regulator [Paraburkholderia sp.]